MVTHDFVCSNCDIIVQDTSAEKTHYCSKCGKAMRWDLVGNRSSRGDYNFVSDSLAINPEQIAEHKKEFPDVGVLPDGRIEFNSFRQHDRYLKKTGFYKHPKKIRP